MKTGSSFLALEPGNELVEVTFDGRRYMLPDGANLAASLLAAGAGSFRSMPVSGAPRAPYCMMGGCFDCLVVVDGVTVQACMTEVRDGLVIARAHGREAV